MLTLLSAPATRPQHDLRTVESLGTAAAYLGLEPLELRAWLENGGSFAGVARILGRPPAGLFEVVVESVRARLDPRLPAHERDRLLAEVRTHLASGRSETLLGPAA